MASRYFSTSFSTCATQQLKKRFRGNASKTNSPVSHNSIELLYILGRKKVILNSILKCHAEIAIFQMKIRIMKKLLNIFKVRHSYLNKICL